MVTYMNVLKMLSNLHVGGDIHLNNVTIRSGQSVNLGSSVIQGNSHIINDIRGVDNFSSIELSCPADVIYKVAECSTMKIEGPSNVLPLLCTIVKNNVLYIDIEQPVNLVGPLKLEISSPMLLEVTVNGSGSMSLQNVESSSFNATLNGSGNIDIQGNIQKINIDIQGSGNVKAYKTCVNSAHISVVGSGNAKMYVTNTVQAKVVGPGCIKVKGNPVNRQVQTIGPGKIKFKDD